MTTTMQLPITETVDEDVTIDRDTLFARALHAARNGEPLLGIWFATMVGDPRYDDFPLRLPEDLARRLGLVTRSAAVLNDARPD